MPLLFHKICDINPSYSETIEMERYCEFHVPSILEIQSALPVGTVNVAYNLGGVYIICQDEKEVYVGKTNNLIRRLTSYAYSWRNYDARGHHDSNMNIKLLAGAEIGHCFELWISVFKDESIRAVIEANIIRNYHPAWNNILYEGKDYRLKHTTCPECGMSGWWCSGSTCQGYNRMLYDEEFPSMPKEEVKSITHYPPRICPKCEYRVPADSDLPHCNGLILCPCGKWVL